MKLRKTSIGRRALACACSVAMAAMLVPAAAIPAFADATTGGTSSVLTLVTGTAADATQYSLDARVGGAKFSLGNSSKQRAQVQVADDASTVITPGALKAIAKDNTAGSTAGWYGIYAKDSTNATKNWEWAFNSSNYSVANVTATSNYKLQVATTQSGNLTTKVTLAMDSTQSLPTTASLLFPAASLDGNYLLLTAADGTQYTGLVTTDATFTGNKVCTVPGIKAGGTYTVSQVAFSIYGRDAATGATTLLKTYTEDELADITKNYPQVSYNLGNTIYTAKSYVGMDDLFGDISQWKSGSYIEFTCSDTVYTMNEPTYDKVTSSDYKFYPNYAYNSDSTQVTYSTASSVTTKPVIAFSYWATLLTSGQTALDGVTTNMQSAAKLDTIDCPRWFEGTLDTDYANKTLPSGKMTPSGIVYPTIVYQHGISDATISGLSDMTYNGTDQSVAPVVTVGSTTLTAGTDYTYTPATVNKAGAYKVTITGMGKYTGTKTATLKVNPTKASPKITVGTDKMAVRYAATGASKYKIYYRVSGTSKWKGVVTTSTKALIKGLTTGKKYQVKVQSIASGVSSTMSGIVTSAKIK